MRARTGFIALPRLLWAHLKSSYILVCAPTRIFSLSRAPVRIPCLAGGKTRGFRHEEFCRYRRYTSLLLLLLAQCVPLGTLIPR